MNPFESWDTVQTAFKTLHEIIPDLSHEAWLTWRRSPTTFQPDWPWELELNFHGISRWLGGQTATGTGTTPEEAWDNLLRALG